MNCQNLCKCKGRCSCGINYKNIPAALGDDTGEFKPENGAYFNTVVKYEENDAVYFYTCEGVPIKISSECECERDEPVEVDISIADGESWWLYNNGLEVGPNQSISGRLIPIADIASSADSSVHYSLKELFDLIEAGEDVVINGVPLNYSGDGTSGGVALLAPAHNTDKLRMNSRVESEREVGPGEIAAVTTWSGITLSSGLPLGYGIERQTYNGVSTYAFYAQGVETSGGPI